MHLCEQSVSPHPHYKNTFEISLGGIPDESAARDLGSDASHSGTGLIFGAYHKLL